MIESQQPSTTTAPAELSQSRKSRNSKKQQVSSSKRNHQTEAPLKRLGLYEKSLLLRVQREDKLRLLRAQLMEECTFTPNTVKSQSTHTATNTSLTSTESVWDRLYHQHRHPQRHQHQHQSSNSLSSSASRATTPVLSNKRKPSSNASPACTETTTPTTSPTCQHSPHQSRPASIDKATTATDIVSPHHPASSLTTASHTGSVLTTTNQSTVICSVRVEQLYEQGVRKLRNRPSSARIEKEWRDRRHFEETDLPECTFNPFVAVPNKSRDKKLQRQPNDLLEHPLNETTNHDNNNNNSNGKFDIPPERLKTHQLSGRHHKSKTFVMEPVRFDHSSSHQNTTTHDNSASNGNHCRRAPWQRRLEQHRATTTMMMTTTKTTTTRAATMAACKQSLPLYPTEILVPHHTNNLRQHQYQEDQDLWNPCVQDDFFSKSFMNNNKSSQTIHRLTGRHTNDNMMFPAEWHSPLQRPRIVVPHHHHRRPTIGLVEERVPDNGDTAVGAVMISPFIELPSVPGDGNSSNNNNTTMMAVSPLRGPFFDNENDDENYDDYVLEEDRHKYEQEVANQQMDASERDTSKKNSSSCSSIHSATSSNSGSSGRRSPATASESVILQRSHVTDYGSI